MTPISRIALAIPLLALITSCSSTRNVVRKSPTVPETRVLDKYAGAAPSGGFVAPSHETIDEPMSKEGRRISVYLTSKFVDLDTKQFKKHEVFGDVAYQIKLRKLVKMKGVDLMSSPSVVTTPGQRAKVEIIRELKLKGAAFDEMLNLGVTLEIKPAILKNGRIQLSGISTVREVDSPEVAFGDNRAISVQSNDTYFDVSLKPGQTAQLIMRDSGTPGQRVVFVTAELIDGRVDEEGNLRAKLDR